MGYCYPLRNKNNDKRFPDYSRPNRHLYNENPINNVRPLYRSETFHNENTRSYEFLNHNDFNCYTQRHIPFPPLPARNDYFNPISRHDNYTNATDNCLRKTSPLRTSMKTLPRMPLLSYDTPNKNENLKDRQLNNMITESDDLEQILIQLAKTSDFNLIDAFRIFDTNCNGYITLSDINNGLDSLGISADNVLILNFIRKYDSDLFGNLKYSDFCDAFIPKDKIFAQQVKAKPPYNIYSFDFKDNYFSPSTRALIKQAFKIHFKNV